MRRKNNLCLDLADIYKPIIVDRVLLTLINKHMIDPSLHFTYENDECLLNKEGLTIVLKELKRKLTQKLQSDGRSITYLQIMKNDINQLADCIENDRRFHPFTAE